MMKAVAVLALLAACVAVALGSGENVLTLTAANFDQTINNNEFVLVEFFAPWCGHCKTLAPEFEKAAAILKKDGVILGAVDSTIERDLAGQFGVRGYPTLKLFRNGKPEEYKGGRTEATIVSWIRKATGPAAKNIIGQGAIIDFSQDNKVAVVGFFEENSEELKAFMSAASGDDTAAYAYSTSSTDATANGATFPGMILFKKFDEGKNVFSGSLTLESIKSFVQTNSVPLVIDFDMSVVGSIFQSKVGKVAFLFSETPNTDFNELAQEFRGQLVFARANSKEPRLNQHIGIEPSQFPKLFILDTSANMVKYPAPGGVSKEEMKNHIARFLAGEAEAHFKSEEIPVPNDGPVTVVVGKNWQQVVLDEEKDVLLEIYAPWCGHCKKLEPIWNELGTHYQDNKNVVIAKMDGTANEVADVNVRGFPTIKFYPAGKKDNKGLDYDGGREYDDFVNYLNTHGKAKNHDEL